MVKRIAVIISIIMTLTACAEPIETVDIQEVSRETSREVSVEKNMISGSMIKAEDFDDTIEYEQDGYVGTLQRNDDTFTVDSTGTKNVSRTMTETKVYTALPRNDMSLIDTVYNGMNLMSVDWQTNTGQSVRGFTDETPHSYSAVAYYRGVKTYKVTTGYTASVTYTGTVSVTE